MKTSTAPIYGHMDYGKKDPSLGWRFHRRLAVDGRHRRQGHPQRLPVDEWGIRVAERCRRSGSSVERGGHNSPGRSTPSTKYVDWMKKYAPEGGHRHDLRSLARCRRRGQIAQQIFWYTAFTADMNKPGLPVVNADGTPKWRMAPQRPYWKRACRTATRTSGRWTLIKSIRSLTANGGLAPTLSSSRKTTSLKKSDRRPHLHPRQRHPKSTSFFMDARQVRRLIEFYRSPARVAWIATGTNNVPDYPKLAQLWWKNIGPW